METQTESVPQKYIFKTCSTAGCGVMIGWAIGSLQGMTQCKWCISGQREEREGHLKRLRDEQKQAQEARTPLKEALGRVIGPQGS